MNIEITDLARQPGRTIAVAGVGPRAGPGGFGVLGRNGAGKTSLPPGLGQRATVVVSTHLAEDAGTACTQAGPMDRGRIVCHGTPGGLAARGEGHGTCDAPLERGRGAVLEAARS